MSGTTKKATKSPAAKRPQMLVATKSFLAPGGVLIRKGTAVEASDDVVKGREAMFVPAEQTFRTTRG